MDSREVKDQKSISLQRNMAVFANRKSEEYYADAQWIAGRAIEAGLSKNQVSSMLSTINTTSSSAEFLNYLKRQVGKAQKPSKFATDTLPAWIELIQVHQNSEQKKAFGEVLVEKLENVRKQAIDDAKKEEMSTMGTDDKAKLCVLYIRQFLKAFEAHYLYQSVPGKDSFEESLAS